MMTMPRSSMAFAVRRTTMAASIGTASRSPQTYRKTTRACWRSAAMTATVTFSPGASTGVLTSNGDITLGSGSTFTVELNGNTPGAGYDQLNVVGAVTLNQGMLAASLGYDPTGPDALIIINNDGADPVLGTFVGLPEGSTLPLTLS